MKTALRFLIEDEGYAHYEEDSKPILSIPKIAEIMEKYAQQYKDQIERMKDPLFYKAAYDVKYIKGHSKGGKNF